MELPENFDKEAFIQGTELAIDWNFPIPDEQYQLYEELIKERSCES